MALADQAVLSADATFQGRVRQAMVAAAIAIQNEAATAAFHTQRANLAKSVLNTPNQYVTLFTNAVATDTTVGTQAGSPATQASVTDAAISNAVSSMWNSFFSVYA